jgi:hypothetical protein
MTRDPILRVSPWLILASAFAVACAGGSGEPPDGVAITTRDSAGIQIVEHTVPAGRVPAAVQVRDSASVMIGIADGEAPYVFGLIASANRLSDGRIAIADARSQDIRFFDPSGRFLEKVGSQGDGPGEFRRFTEIVRIPGDTLLIGDGRLARLTAIGPTGDVEREVKLPRLPSGRAVGFLGRFADGTLLGATTASYGDDAESGVKEEHVTYYRMSADGATADSIVRLFSGNSLVEVSGTATNRTIRIGGIVFSPSSSLAVDTGGFHYTDGRSYSIASYTKDGKLARVITLNREPAPVTDADKAAYRERQLANARPERRAEIETALRDHPYPATHPALTHLLVDDAGRLWARDRIVGDEPPRWWVFSPGGQLLGSANVPKGCSPLEIGREHVLCRVTDDLDVERIQLHSLGGAPGS